jgi:GGDEF domain-containing protein
MQTWTEEQSSFLPVHETLNTTLRFHLQTLFPAVPFFTVLLLHISQLEHIQIPPETAVVHKRQRYHASASILEQVMVNVRRAIRGEDLVYIDTGRGAAIIFPDVDAAGAHKIIERVYNNVNLLQAETLIPPLTHETEIVLGIGSYPEQGTSLEPLLASAGCIFYRLTLRRAITPHLWDTMPPAEFPSSAEDDDMQTTNEFNEDGEISTDNTSLITDSSLQDFKAVPYLQLPNMLSTRLKSLISYDIASRFRCVPVGRDHQRLTIAMADPTDTETIQKLHEATHMTIFPVSCDSKALDQLLKTKW